MKLKNTDQNILRNLVKNSKTMVYASLIPYKSNSCIKAYDEEGNPLGDIPEENISEYLNETNIVLFIEETIDDETGLPIYVLKTIV